MAYARKDSTKKSVEASLSRTKKRRPFMTTRRKGTWLRMRSNNRRTLMKWLEERLKRPRISSQILSRQSMRLKSFLRRSPSDCKTKTRKATASR